MVGRISAARAAEARALRRQQMFQAVSGTIGLVTPILVAGASFYAYTVMYERPLTASTAFAALAWLDLLRNPLYSLPAIISNVVQLTVSFGYGALLWVVVVPAVRCCDC